MISERTAGEHRRSVEVLCTQERALGFIAHLGCCGHAPPPFVGAGAELLVVVEFAAVLAGVPEPTVIGEVVCVLPPHATSTAAEPK